MGAFIATPLAAFIKAYYEVFFERKDKLVNTDSYVDRMLFRKLND